MSKNESSAIPPFRSTGSVAACAVGAVGAISLGASEAAIVYVDFGDAVIADLTANDGNFRIVPIDLDGDGAFDLRLLTRIDAINGNVAGLIGPAGGTLDVVGEKFGNFFYPDRLAVNKGVDTSAAFIPLASAIGSMAFNGGFSKSKWAVAPANTGYLGLRFQISGASHYGWMRLTVAPNNAAQPRALTVHEWAYESTPNTPILTGAIPEPGGLGLLALGGLGVALHRRRTSPSNGGLPPQS